MSTRVMTTRAAHASAIPTRKVERADLRLWVTVTAGITLVALLGLLYISQTSAVSNIGYDIQQLESEKRLLQAKNDQLQLQISQLKSLSRVEREATAILQMASPQQVLYSTTPVAVLTATVDSQTGNQAGATNTTAASTVSTAPDSFAGLERLLPFVQRPLETTPAK